MIRFMDHCPGMPRRGALLRRLATGNFTSASYNGLYRQVKREILWRNIKTWSNYVRQQKTKKEI